ncbi:hypothetical protein B4589_004415 [Halolamina sp. CBA1230]|uniref:hypothetical protein n=1 Tax=Halolamina sp. CBA1230 TaxID=1853690 RepID=UPI00117A18C9|nr:hypothetical protein [Halolamina sp. CBA1230]QKY19659.1 hypothetical protein B4589_004415 [Halolamina sp. CBA1230]
MKSGSGSDPFETDSNNDDAEESADNEAETTDTPEENGQDTAETQDHEQADSATADHSESIESTSRTDREGLPYIYGRNSVKDDRKMIQYFLREETEAIEDDVKRAVESELGTDVLLTDLREALVRVAAEHPEEVADELRDWGYEYEED